MVIATPSQLNMAGISFVFATLVQNMKVLWILTQNTTEVQMLRVTPLFMFTFRSIHGTFDLYSWKQQAYPKGW